MASVLDVHGGGAPFQIVKERDDTHHGDRMWIFVILLVFLALLFLWGKKDHQQQPYHQPPQYDQYGNIIPAMMMCSAMQHKQQPHYNDGRHHEYQHWDIIRDEAKQFGEVKQQISETAYTQARESDRYFFDTNRNIDQQAYNTSRQIDAVAHASAIGFKENEVQGLKNTAQVIARVDDLEKRMDQEKIADLREQLAQERVVNRLQPRAPVAAYWPSYPAPVQHNSHYSCAPHNPEYYSA